MPYISKLAVKEIRSQIKDRYPKKDGWDISVRMDHHDCIRVRIFTAPYNMLSEGSKYEQVNQYHIDRFYSGRGAMDLKQIYNIVNQFNGVLVEDGDYGTVPNYYISINVGSWDKPFKVV